MGRSFFNGSTDAELAAGSRNFAQKIATGWASLGLTEAMVQAYVALDAQWQAAYRAALDPGSRTRSKVADKNQVRGRLTAMASGLAAIIGANPNVSDSARILLGLGVRDKPSPIAPPGQPTRLTTRLDGDGSLFLSWKCDNPKGSRGTQYELWRRQNGGAFELLAIVGKKRYRDYSLPVGATEIVYKLRATRSTKVGEWAIFPVNFGGGRPNMFEMQKAA